MKEHAVIIEVKYIWIEWGNIIILLGITGKSRIFSYPVGHDVSSVDLGWQDFATQPRYMAFCDIQANYCNAINTRCKVLHESRLHKCCCLVPLFMLIMLTKIFKFF